MPVVPPSTAGPSTAGPSTAAATEPEWGESLDLLDHEQANLAAFEGVFPYWNSRDVEAMLDFYDDEIVWHNVAMGEVYDGKAAVKAFLERLFTALPDLSLEVTLRVPRGRYVAEEYVIRGTHLGPMFGLPATGRPLAIPAMSMVELRDGRLKEDHFYFDAATAMRQMGYLPPIEAAQTRWGAAALQVLAHRRRIGLGVLGAAGVALVAASLRGV